MNSLHAPTLLTYGYAPDIHMTEMLTPRELDVLPLLATGHDNKSIGRALGIHWMTVRVHVGNIISKFGANNRTHAIHIAYELGYLIPGEPSRPRGPQTAQEAIALAAHYAALANRLLQGEGR